ncbi:MAG: (2Fe-2S)-binding protein [Pseudomonadota bacterium]
MIVCSCNFITEEDIEAVVHGFMERDAWQLVTVGMVYHALEKRGKCCGCFPNAISIIVRAVEAWHHANDTPAAEIYSFVDQLHLRLANDEKMRARVKHGLQSARAA